MKGTRGGSKRSCLDVWVGPAATLDFLGFTLFWARSRRGWWADAYGNTGWMEAVVA